MEKQLLKDLESLSKFDLRKELDLDKSELITDEHFLACGIPILFGFDYDEFFYEIDSRLNDKLGKLQLEEDGFYKLTKYGLSLYSRIGVHSKDRIKQIIIDIKEITDLSTLKVKTIIAMEHESNRKIILTLTQQNIKQAKFNYWEIKKNPIHVRGVENEIGIYKTIFYFQFNPPSQLTKKEFTILSFIARTSFLGDYLLKERISGELFKIKESYLEPFIPLTPENWNYNEGLYESLRGGLKIALENPVLGTGIILGFDNCETIDSVEDYFNLTTINLVDMKLSTKDKDLFQVQITGNRVLILLWTDLENQLDMERKEILKKKNSFKRRGEEPMLVQIEGPIKKQEVMLLGENEKIFYYLDEPEITSENF